ncbi:glycosyltransferase family 4 protein [Hafnia alvei]|uniref:glycosyltransferase family 4 protein n=1 Tax=Hafnia alvei TaxID=569 RepID=UPI000E02FE48|nr:glycosyltransferase family 4 protein [Hafnia alvei]STQ70530.1 Probable poly(glycerol-phosphate) alpha-glucosyltransferase [Hafnia alvei]
MNKVCIVITDVSLSGGTERVAATLSSALQLAGFDVTLFSLWCRHKKPFFQLNEGVTLCSDFSGNRYSRILNVLLRVKRNGGVLIVISMGRLSSEISLLGKIIGIKRIILSEHVSFGSFSKIKKAIKLVSYKISDVIVVLTATDKELLQRHKVNVVDIANINPYVSPVILKDHRSRENIAIAVGRLTYQKNFQKLIYLWGKANTNSWKLEIIGDGEDRGELIDYINNNNLSGHVTISPSTKNIHEVYQKAKLFLMTSRYEGLPMVLIESQAFGVPAIAMDCDTGPRDIIIDGITGYLVENSDTDFMEKIEKYTGNESIGAEMSINALVYSERFSEKNIIHKWIEIINEGDFDGK